MIERHVVMDFVPMGEYGITFAVLLQGLSKW